MGNNIDDDKEQSITNFSIGTKILLEDVFELYKYSVEEDDARYELLKIEEITEILTLLFFELKFTADAIETKAIIEKIAMYMVIYHIKIRKHIDKYKMVGEK